MKFHKPVNHLTLDWHKTYNNYTDNTTEKFVSYDQKPAISYHPPIAISTRYPLHRTTFTKDCKPILLYHIMILIHFTKFHVEIYLQ